MEETGAKPLRLLVACARINWPRATFALVCHAQNRGPLMRGKTYTPEYCLERARACELLARETAQEEARDKFRSLAAQWRVLAEDGEQVSADEAEELEQHIHIDVTV